jgi:hypothetical protein
VSGAGDEVDGCREWAGGVWMERMMRVGGCLYYDGGAVGGGCRVSEWGCDQVRWLPQMG